MTNKGRGPLLRDRYTPTNLFALVPALSLALESVLTQLDHLLATPCSRRPKPIWPAADRGPQLTATRRPRWR
jgi:hypothetical protein